MDKQPRTTTTSHTGFSRWMQHKMNARMNRKIRGGKGSFMGMDVLILNTVGRRSGEPRHTPLSWFADGEDGWLLVASGGKNADPDWCRNLMAHPEGATIELPGRPPLPVTPRVLDGAERAAAWQVVTTAQPRYGKYQAKSEHEYAVVRLSPR